MQAGSTSLQAETQTLDDRPVAARAPQGCKGESRATSIIAAANQLLEEGGLEGLTIRAVLARTGLSRRAFYENFAGKDDLVLAVFEQTLRDAADAFRAIAELIDDPVERIRAFVVRIALASLTPEDDPAPAAASASDRRSAAMSREHLRLAEARPAELEAALRPLVTFIAEQVEEGIRRGQLRDSDPALQAKLIYNLVATTTHTELLTHEGSPDRLHRQQLAGEIWEFCRLAIIR